MRRQCCVEGGGVVAWWHGGMVARRRGITMFRTFQSVLSFNILSIAWNNSHQQQNVLLPRGVSGPRHHATTPPRHHNLHRMCRRRFYTQKISDVFACKCSPSLERSQTRRRHQTHNMHTTSHKCSPRRHRKTECRNIKL